jgi:hypothetical protein
MKKCIVFTENYHSKCKPIETHPNNVNATLAMFQASCWWLSQQRFGWCRITNASKFAFMVATVPKNVARKSGGVQK